MIELVDPVWAKLSKLSSCLCAAIEEAGVDPVCFCGVMPGVAVALDYTNFGCKTSDGMAWVRLSTEYLTEAFPNPLVRESKCGTEIAFVAEVGMVRSMPLNDDGEPPDAATMMAAAERQITEASIMRKAVVCCLKSGSILGAYTPVGPDGGAIGGSWLVSIPTLDP